MKTNLIYLVIFGLVVYLILSTKKTLTATQAAVQADNNLVAIEPAQTPVVQTIVQQAPQETAVDYLAVYNNA